MSAFSVSGLLVAVTAFPLAFVVIAYQPWSRLNRLYALFLFVIGLWGAISFLIGSQLSPFAALIVWKFAHLGIITIPVLFFLFVSAFCHYRFPKNFIPSYLYLIGSLVIVLNITSHTLVQGVRQVFGAFYYMTPGWVYTVFLVWWWSVVVMGFAVLFSRYRIVDLVEKKRIKLMVLGLLVGFSGSVMNFFPIFHIDIYPWGNFAIPIAILLQAYAIFVYRLMDVEIVITKTGLFLATYVVVLGVPSAVGWWGRRWLEKVFGEGWWFVPVSLCTVLATVGPFMYAYLRRQAEARLLKDQRRYQRTLQLAARGMTRVRNVTHLANLITRLVSRTVQVTHASLFLWDAVHQRYVLHSSHGSKRLAPQSRYGLEASHPLVRWLMERHQVLGEENLLKYPDQAVSQELASLEAAIAVPGLIGKRLIGFLALGPKRSGAGYAPDDLHAFATLANEAALALENASSYEELLRANEQLKAASERLLLQERLATVGQFAAGMAHEIKNPLSAIKTFAEYLPKKYQDPVFREKFFRIVRAEVDRINDIVQDLSAFAKPAPPQLQPVHLSALIKDTLALLSNQCLKQHIEVSNILSQNGSVINGDPQQLKQVLLNLLLNSLEVMPKGGRLEVRTEWKQGWITLRISDTGAGIPVHEQHKIWDPFFTTKERGMGLGLAIVRGIVERHGGRITLSSALGKGTSVEVVLPVLA